MSLKDAIKAEAKNLGFLMAGVSLPRQPAHFVVYERWIQAGRHASMAYLAAENAMQRRSDPFLILPEVRSILSFAISYSVPIELPAPIADHRPTGRVAAYAWGQDYHAVIPSRLERLANFISQSTGRPLAQRRYTDTGPLLERDLAQQAGLGWIGKNTCLISPSAGSFFFLGELFLDVELEPDEAFIPDRCGSCQRCIQACPTGCIRPDRTLDSGRCISFLTIENKSEIPLELRPQVGAWLFGCDICQSVCPWNQRFATHRPDPVFLPAQDLPTPDLISELALTPHDFNRKYRHSPLQRAHRRGYLRNVCVALGNQPHPAAVAPLAALLETDPEPLIRSHAAWALAQIDTPAARAALKKFIDLKK